MRRISPLATLLFGAVTCAPLFSACASGSEAQLEPIRPVSGAVRSTIVVPLVVEDASGRIQFAMHAPRLPGLDRTTVIATTLGGGEFRWTPLASHIGTHEITFDLYVDGDKTDSEMAIVTVTPADDAAPVFLSPSAGRTYDLERDPAVEFDVEVRDDDSLEVELRAREELPMGAELEQTSGKQGHFRWVPTPDQIASSQRWTISLEADDGEHEPTRLDTILVLRTEQRENCPGEPPVVQIVSPRGDARVAGDPGYTVEIEATDDRGLRDAPLLYYTTTEPEDPEKPDISLMQQAEFVQEAGERYRAHIPALDVADGASLPVWIVASVTDNDDEEGALCDHQTDSKLVRFEATRGMAGGGMTCASCNASNECASGICVTSATGGRCLPACDDATPCAAGTCDDRTTAEGAVVQACGTATTVCEGGVTCTEDAHEPNDSSAAATLIDGAATAQICDGNDDYFRVDVASGTQVDLSISFTHGEHSDLDLALLNAAGMIVDSSASEESTESVSFCAAAATTLYARVHGFARSEASYSVEVARTSSSCCVDDGGENDDTRTTARAASGSFTGQICPSDDDFLGVNVSGPSTIRASIAFSHAAGDLDFELYDPSGARVARSLSVTDMESLTHEATSSGTYALRVYGHLGATTSYMGMVTVEARTSCTTSASCPAEQVCSMGSCVARTCTTMADCPTGLGCPEAGLATTSECGTTCTVNSDCRSTESCKRFASGRYCARRGTGANGDPCRSFTDCGGQRACLALPGGYCARAGCTSNADCESGTWCVQIDGVAACALDCAEAETICRSAEGYSCQSRADVDMVTQFVCAP